MKIELDRGLANTLGISVNDAAQALRVAFAGGKPGMPGNKVPARCSFSNISRLCST